MIATAMNGHTGESHEDTNWMLQLNREAESKFFAADVNGDGHLTPEELKGMIMELLVGGGYVKQESEQNDKVVREFIEREVKLAMSFDTNWDGKIDFDEFVVYYNTFVDKVQYDSAGHLDPSKLREHFDLEEAAHARAVERVNSEYDPMFRKLQSTDGDIGDVGQKVDSTRSSIFQHMHDKDSRLQDIASQEEHGAAWVAARDTLRERAFGDSSEVVRYLLDTTQAREACSKGVAG